MKFFSNTSNKKNHHEENDSFRLPQSPEDWKDCEKLSKIFSYRPWIWLFAYKINLKNLKIIVDSKNFYLIINNFCKVILFNRWNKFVYFLSIIWIICWTIIFWSLASGWYFFLFYLLNKHLISDFNFFSFGQIRSYKIMFPIGTVLIYQLFVRLKQKIYISKNYSILIFKNFFNITLINICARTIAKSLFNSYIYYDQNDYKTKDSKESLNLKLDIFFAFLLIYLFLGVYQNKSHVTLSLEKINKKSYILRKSANKSLSYLIYLINYINYKIYFTMLALLILSPIIDAIYSQIYFR